MDYILRDSDIRIFLDGDRIIKTRMRASSWALVLFFGPCLGKYIFFAIQFSSIDDAGEEEKMMMLLIKLKLTAVY